MFEAKSVLVIEDNAYLAMDLAAAVERLDGRVVGPAGTVAESLGLLEREEVAAAVLDYQMPDGNVIPLARALVSRKVPFVIHSSTPLGPEMTLLRAGVPVMMKPIQPDDLVAVLGHEVERCRRLRQPHERVERP